MLKKTISCGHVRQQGDVVYPLSATKIHFFSNREVLRYINYIAITKRFFYRDLP